MTEDEAKRRSSGAVNVDSGTFARAGRLAWAFIGIVGAAAIVVAGLAVVSSVVLPLLFATVLAVLFRPAAVALTRRGAPPGIAAGIVVLVVIAVVVGAAVLAARGVISQSSELLDDVEAGLRELDVSGTTAADVREALSDLEPTVAFGFGRAVVSGLSVIGGLATSALLGVLVLYYLLKDGPKLRDTLVQRAPEAKRATLDVTIGEACSVLRRYWWGRTIVSAVVTVVVGVGALVLDLPLVLTLVIVTFIGGYVPYVGALVGGLLATVLALGSGGLTAGIVMLVVVLVANLGVENLVDPIVTGRTLQIHPLVVLLVTAAGGIVGGLVGLILAVPATVIAGQVLRRLPELVDLTGDPAT